MLLVELLGGKRLRGGPSPPELGDLQTAVTGSYLHSRTYLNEGVHEMGVITSVHHSVTSLCSQRCDVCQHHLTVFVHI